ncbi:tryptophan synthase beta subunit-like PLP-dependent enzyme [Fomitopsis serialis]|uniref:tryptophan synthase beta subunit-like PLP-dependent enzyme n=1 Tax=Fomitopsis serialis TaxID=139415 RepID=UPI0020080F2B|nr:tryptophan synthase beta subunit-like PLP-dependent enzyme [Neoantrodia serialis]KAH9934924.1 tryptophan synthase beta subunit-like PLP-dependent enzyme [Neoantrodia serialis]
MTTAADSDPEKLWLETPLIHSPHISARLNCNVYLKLEHFQPGQSFKSRGISYFILHARRQRGPDVHVIIASSGNAGLAAACASKALRLRCTVFLPEGVDASTVEFMKREGAEIVTAGKIYLDASRAAEQAVAADSNAVMVPAYNEPLLWEGHSSMIAELTRQLPNKAKPDAIFCSVGGAGLCGGVMLGCKSVGWDDVPVVALETTGSSCFYQSLALNPGAFSTTTEPAKGVRPVHCDKYDVTVAHLPTLTSRATSLGASSPASGSVRMALDRKGGIKSVCVDDELAMQAGLLFANEHKILAELACSTTLVPAYSRELFNKLVPPSTSGDPRTVVFVVCGGFKISVMEFDEYRTIVESKLKRQTHWEVLCNGEQWKIAV